MKLLKLRARQKVSSFFSRTFQTKLNSVAYLGLGRIRLTSRAYDYMNMMWILRRRIFKISFIFGIYDVNILHIFSSVHILIIMICKKALRLMLVFMLVYWMRSKLNLVCCGPTYPIKSQGTREKKLIGTWCIEYIILRLYLNTFSLARYIANITQGVPKTR